MTQAEKPTRKRIKRNLLIALGALAVFLLVMVLRLPRSHSIPSHLGSNAQIKVLATYPHDPNAFTEGLIYADDYFYESAGLYGHSTCAKSNRLLVRWCRSSSSQTNTLPKG